MVIKNSSNTPQAASTQSGPKGQGKEIIELVKQDLEARAKVGKEKYGESLRSFNGRNAVLDAYQEALDLVMYMRQVLDEQEEFNYSLKRIVQGSNVYSGPNFETMTDAERYISLLLVQLYQKIHKGDKYGVNLKLGEFLSILIKLQKLYGE